MAIVIGHVNVQVGPGLTAGQILTASDGTQFQVVDRTTLIQLSGGVPLGGAAAVSINGGKLAQGGDALEDGQGTVTIPLQGT